LLYVTDADLLPPSDMFRVRVLDKANTAIIRLLVDNQVVHEFLIEQWMSFCKILDKFIVPVLYRPSTPLQMCFDLPESRKGFAFYKPFLPQYSTLYFPDSAFLMNYVQLFYLLKVRENVTNDMLTILERQARKFSTCRL